MIVRFDQGTHPGGDTGGPRAVRWAEAYVEEHRLDVPRLVERRTRWRRQPASEKQVAILIARKLHVPPGLTKGQASHLIGMPQERK